MESTSPQMKKTQETLQKNDKLYSDIFIVLLYYWDFT